MKLQLLIILSVFTVAHSFKVRCEEKFLSYRYEIKCIDNTDSAVIFHKSFNFDYQLTNDRKVELITTTQKPRYIYTEPEEIMQMYAKDYSHNSQFTINYW